MKGLAGKGWEEKDDAMDYKKVIGKKGDVNRYILYSIVLLILMILIIALFQESANELIKALFIKKFLK